MSEPSVLSDSETVSSSGLETKDVALFYHEAVMGKILEAEKILRNENVTCSLADRDEPAGRHKINNKLSIARHCDIRVFILTKKFVDEELENVACILLNSKISNLKNTLILATGKQLRNLPTSMRHFECQTFPGDVSGKLVARFILKFLKKHQPDLILKHGIASQFSSGQPEHDLAEKRYLQFGIEKDYENKFKRFETEFGVSDSKRAFILIASPITQSLPGLENIVLIPWTRVFDFDPKSRVSGLLSVTESQLKKERNHTKTDRLDEIDIPEDNTTNWVFINGYTDGEESLHPARGKGLDRKALYKHADVLCDYCAGKKVPTLLVMWYPTYDNMDRDLDRFLNAFVAVFSGKLDDSFSCVVCVETIPDPDTGLYASLERLDLLERIIAVPLNVLCRWLAAHLHPTEKVAKRTLPRFSDEDEDVTTVEIAEEEYNWIKVHVDLLTTPVSLCKDQDMEKNGVAFLKGAEATWDIIGKSNFVINRDLLDGAKKYLKEKHIDNGLTGKITIFHFPGGGGTTFSRQLLWEFRKSNPCVELSSIRVNVEELKDRLMYLRSLTGLPIILLADGKSDHDVKKIIDIGRDLPVIVIQVKRFYSALKRGKSSAAENCFLTHEVTESESKQLCYVYSRQVPAKTSSLTKLHLSKGKRIPSLFEYGLTAFQEEYHGVRRYVHGFLQLSSSASELQPWHHVLAFLSIANYYGHRALPSYMFRKILNKQPNEVADLDDLPHAARQFITEDKVGYWKITHYIVSKEILEQILVMRDRPTTFYRPTSSRGTELSSDAKAKLCHWALLFIENVKTHMESVQRVPSHISYILTSIFIKRYYRDPGDNDADSKSLYSRLLEDTESKADQKAILMKLVTEFPTEPEFHAHLGRFYYKQAQFLDAEKCLQKALYIRMENVPRNQGTQGDEVLQRIYNMFGFCYYAHVTHEIGARFGDVSRIKIRKKPQRRLISLCLENAEKAIENFKEGMKWYQKGFDPTFAYMGEIKVRLHIAELATVITDSDLQHLEKDPSPRKELYRFVMESFSECDHLLAQCIHYVSEADMPEDEINFCINKFQVFFKSSEAALKHWAGTDGTIKSKRCHISIIKMHLKKSSKGHRFRIYDDVKETRKLMELVDLFEGILDEVFRSPNRTVMISNYMMEWLQAIRHPMIARRYSQSDVLLKVKRWEERNEIGSLATFYRYVLSVLLSLCSPAGKVADAYSLEASQLIDRIDSRAIPLYLLHRSMEWMSNCSEADSIDNLMHISKLGERNGKFWGSKEKLLKLRVCTGTISRCKVYWGKIVLDGGYKPQIVVFFVPNNFGIGASYSRKMARVEFYLGFNPHHKAEAFEVKILKSYPCPECKSQTEIPTLGKEPSECWALCNSCEMRVHLPEHLSED